MEDSLKYGPCFESDGYLAVFVERSLLCFATVRWDVRWVIDGTVDWGGRGFWSRRCLLPHHRKTEGWTGLGRRLGGSTGSVNLNDRPKVLPEGCLCLSASAGDSSIPPSFSFCESLRSSSIRYPLVSADCAGDCWLGGASSFCSISFCFEVEGICELCLRAYIGGWQLRSSRMAGPG
ncbi:hypothetical protein DL93DRAFT_1115522 [Clavulina sp. PMI_390]|nr:hypothetical protein DL93DRAFT_1115522 [Clavulina sp. PMI_390]